MSKKYKCPKCKNALNFDENDEYESGLGHYYCSNDDCEISWFECGSIKVHFETNNVWYEC